jgi:hypothetical protein
VTPGADAVAPEMTSTVGASAASGTTASTDVAVGTLPFPQMEAAVTSPSNDDTLEVNMGHPCL